nr:unnamed protein product [Callosobruchus chinensis]
MISEFSHSLMVVDKPNACYFIFHFQMVCNVMKVKEIIVEVAKEEQVTTEKKCTYKDILAKQKALLKQQNMQILKKFRKYTLLNIFVDT